MRLPNGDLAEVAAEKIRDYLLSPQHPIGRFKARFFRNLGYGPENWMRLAEDLRTAAREGDAWRIESSFGDKFSIVANVVGPSGRSASLISIWIVGSKDSIPRFVTAYPAE